MSVEHVVTHIEDALEHLITQYKDKPRLAALLAAWVKQIQKLEDAYYQLATLRFLDSATGDQLDKLGAIVGEVRQGRADELYRIFIKARIRTNRSLGTAEDILGILLGIGVDLDTPDVFEDEAYFQVFLNTLTALNGETLDPIGLAAIIRRAKPVGVRFGLVAPPPAVEAETTFAFSHVGESNPQRGFGHVGSTAYGGVLSSVYE